MQLAVQPPPPPVAVERRNTNFPLALAFWVFTYLLFAYRANLRYGDAYELISSIRLASTAVGAGLCWLVLSRLIDGVRVQSTKPLIVLATILPASIVVLLARLLLDQMGASNPNGFPGDLRFVMVWGGYFGLWVSASFALRLTPRPAFVARFAGTSQSQQARKTANGKANGIARAELLEGLAMEIASLPTTERKALLEAFTPRSSYETADELES